MKHQTSHTRLAALALASAMLLSACGDSAAQDTASKPAETDDSVSLSGEEDENVTAEESEADSEPEQAEAETDDSGDEINSTEPDPEADALTAYRAILEQPDTYFTDEYEGEDEPTINYTYTLLQMQEELPIPALILKKETISDWQGALCSIIVFQYDPERAEAVLIEGQMSEGVAAAGGYRGGLSASGDGVGILETSWSSGTGNGTIVKITVAGDQLQTDTLFDGFLFDEADETRKQITSQEIEWRDVTDHSSALRHCSVFSLQAS